MVTNCAVDRMAFRVDRALCSLGHFPQRLRFLSLRFVALAECFCSLRFGESVVVKDVLTATHVLNGNRIIQRGKFDWQTWKQNCVAYLKFELLLFYDLLRARSVCWTFRDETLETRACVAAVTTSKASKCGMDDDDDEKFANVHVEKQVPTDVL
ncbi:hypothetical protein T05_1798 [Trichinella murrelli]|uniref:Uncharacterized protein n=1 Tax=Trichinella murrelli TaxID=144512 RepID=A0A0V0TQ76_9BILA|nr:hypothetical protein T05_1798 [Trichinella murrelli]